MGSERDFGRNWCYPGARWWKFDIHCHTPASNDYGRGPRQATLRATSPEEWLLAFMRAGIDCVAVTDHNSGQWIDLLGESLRNLERNGHTEYRPLWLFPGVEITAATGTHVLAVLPLGSTSADIAGLLGRVKYQGTPGTSDGVATMHPSTVVEEIGKAGGIAVLAHVDREAGAWRLRGNTLNVLLEQPGLFAMEVVDPKSREPEPCVQRKLAWARVLGSDSHHPAGSDAPRFPGSSYTWIKMEEPSLEGLRLALLDGGGFSIRRSDEAQPFDPWALPEHFVERIEIEDARYMGRGDSETLRFSPWLNALVGGRGTGKSTVLHALRLVAGRERELMDLHEGSAPRQTFERFSRVPAHRQAAGGLGERTKVRWTVMRDGVRHRVQWTSGGGDVLVEVEHAGGWKPAPVQSGGPDRFPLRLFSQGQIAALSGDDQLALLNLIDQAAGVDAVRENLNTKKDAVLASQAQVRKLDRELAKQSDVAIRLEDVERKLERFEEAGHSRILTAYRRRRRQLAEVNRQLAAADAAADRIDETTAEFQPEDLPRDLFNPDTVEERQVIAVLEGLATAVHNTAKDLQQGAGGLRQAACTQRKSLKDSAWWEAQRQASKDYRQLVDTLRAEGVTDPTEYGRLERDRQLLAGEARRLESIRRERDQLSDQVRRELAEVDEARRQVSRARDDFLTETLAENDFVRIHRLQYGHDPRVIERSLREVLNVHDDRFRDDILGMENDEPRRGIVAGMLRSLPVAAEQRAREIEGRVATIRDRFKRACAGAGDFSGTFNNYLKREFAKSPEFLDHLLTWFPEDSLIVEYSRTGDGQDFRAIAQASAGQRSAAMLAFLLAQGSEPLVLDQPEDDLDNHLIYELIVRQIRKNKVRRQIIVVTHNPNIVVNGDAEMLHVMDFVGGQCRVVQKGSLQDPAMRDKICRVMEGGREAFKRRYRRLGAESHHV